MKIAFCSIMCNSEFLLNEWLNHYYPIADYICISEGATRKWADALGYSTPRSTDNTNNILDSFSQNKEKISIVRKDNFYQDKLEQSNFFMSVIPNNVDYIWYVDDDEFYLYKDIDKIKKILSERNPTYVEFKQLSFFKSFKYVCSGGDGWAYDTPIPRIFKYHKGASFSDHRPPTILNEHKVDLKSINPILCDETEKMGVFFRHYSYVDEKRVFEKLKYYDKVYPNHNGVPDYYSTVWFNHVWKKWSVSNRVEFEKTNSVHPSCNNAYTNLFTLKHPSVIERAIR